MPSCNVNEIPDLNIKWVLPYGIRQNHICWAVKHKLCIPSILRPHLSSDSHSGGNATLQTLPSVPIENNLGNFTRSFRRHLAWHSVFRCQCREKCTLRSAEHWCILTPVTKVHFVLLASYSHDRTVTSERDSTTKQTGTQADMCLYDRDRVTCGLGGNWKLSLLYWCKSSLYWKCQEILKILLILFHTTPLI